MEVYRESSFVVDNTDFKNSLCYKLYMNVCLIYLTSLNKIIIKLIHLFNITKQDHN